MTIYMYDFLEAKILSNVLGPIITRYDIIEVRLVLLIFVKISLYFIYFMKFN